MRIIFLLFTLIVVKIGICQCDILVFDNSICYDDCSGVATTTNPVGTAPFDYLWSNGQITETATNLCADSTYWVQITDALGCQAIAHVTMESVLTIIINEVIDESCESCCDGEIDFTAFGGNAPYLFEIIYPDSHSGSIYYGMQFCSGSYQLCIRDSHNCRKCEPFVVENTSSSNLSIDNSKLKIFPNPSSGKIIVETPAEDFEIVLINQFGTVVQKFENQFELDLHDFPAGQYVIRYRDKNTTETHSIVIY